MSHDRSPSGPDACPPDAPRSAGGAPVPPLAADAAAPWREWLGRTQQAQDLITAAPLRLLAATLDRDDPPPVPGTELPPLAHWLYFLGGDRASALGPDGHARRGGFLPPVPLPRRMWAGGRFTFHRPLHVGDAMTRTSTIQDIRAKTGRSGELVFVRVHHEIGDARGPAVSEDHDIVYRARPAAGQPAPSPRPARQDAQFAREIRPDPVLLFRYSALTFNGHRIHYDRTYVTGEEGYPGLVVHGPLIATLLLDLLRREHPAARVAAFEFRALGPLFDTAGFTVCGRLDGATATLWARDPQGGTAMEASATLA